MKKMKTKTADQTKTEKRNFKELATTHIVAHFGGVNALARAIEAPANTVQYWIEQGRFPEDAANKILKAMKARCQEVVRLACIGETIGR